jgi:hypothetical protein
MTITAAQVADTLRLLVPGFVVMKLFYQFGLQTRRSDAQWVVWSLLAAVPVNAAGDALYGQNDIWHAALIFAIALITGVALAALWRNVSRSWPSLAHGFTIRAWDNLFLGEAPWLQVETTDGRVISGWPMYAAKSVDTDDLDLYLAEPRFVEGGSYVDVPAISGILLTRSRIAYIAVVGQSPPALRSERS